MNLPSIPVNSRHLTYGDKAPPPELLARFKLYFDCEHGDLLYAVMLSEDGAFPDNCIVFDGSSGVYVSNLKASEPTESKLIGEMASGPVQESRTFCGVVGDKYELVFKLRADCNSIEFNRYMQAEVELAWCFFTGQGLDDETAAKWWQDTLFAFRNESKKS